MDIELETLKKIAQRVGDNRVFKLDGLEASFAILGTGRKWLDSVDQNNGLFRFSEDGLKVLAQDK